MRKEFQPKIPQHCIEQTKDYVKLYTNHDDLPVLPDLKTTARKYSNQPNSKENLELCLNMCWRPQLTVIGIQGLPSDLSKAGNVVVKGLTYRCSLRIAPSQDGEKMAQQLRKVLLDKKPDDSFNAKVDFSVVDIGNGFSAPDLPPKLKRIILTSTKEAYGGREPIYSGDGGSIPFMEIFSQAFPKANYMLTGCCMPTSNEHCANENLDLEYCRKFITTISLTLSRI